MYRIRMGAQLVRFSGFSCGVAVSLLVACTSQVRPKTVDAESQSYAEAIRQICEVDTLAGVAAEDDELKRSRQREDYIVENTKNGDAIYFATIWRTKLPGERAPMLSAQAVKVGLSSCSLADALREE